MHMCHVHARRWSEKICCLLFDSICFHHIDFIDCRSYCPMIYDCESIDSFIQWKLKVRLLLFFSNNIYYFIASYAIVWVSCRRYFVKLLLVLSLLVPKYVWFMIWCGWQSLRHSRKYIYQYLRDDIIPSHTMSPSGLFLGPAYMLYSHPKP